MATRFLTLCLATAVAAAPAFVPRTLNGTAFDVERGLLADEILLFGKDHLEVVHKDAFAAMLATEGVLHQPPGVDRSLLDFVAPSKEDQELKRLEARQSSCQATTAVVIDTRLKKTHGYPFGFKPI
ncbi:hypothetical protein CTA1_12168 [Colletotrichum tanaceti]|uniref:Uncharacterized protein n=1 Tax=Colletotrichum tanaceti TaxID=1306861 RepID=A0A4U6WYN7_9PEZI|nr:hypothetical protein CTA1_12168 [Colletotrichum tanaceti]